jgi:hypothetical protein
MDATSNPGAAKILCVEADVGLVRSRCAVLKYAGYDPASASPKLAETLLRSQSFDLIVLSRLSEFDLHRIITFADGADVLVLDGFTSPSELLSLVAERLNRGHQRQLSRRYFTSAADCLTGSLVTSMAIPGNRRFTAT